MSAGAGARRGLLAFVLAAAAGAGALLLSTGRTWVEVVVPMPAPLPAQTTTLTGTELVPLCTGVGWVGLAAIVAVLATRGAGRIAVGALLLIAGVTAVAVVPGGVGRDTIAQAAAGTSAVSEAGLRFTLEPWWTGAIAGGVLLAAAGLFVCVRGRAWPGMSSRYDRPRSGTAAAAGSSATRSSTARPSSAEDMWASMDRGADPTNELAGAREPGAAAPDHRPSKEH